LPSEVHSWNATSQTNLGFTHWTGAGLRSDILHLATHGFFAKEDPTAVQTEPESSLNDRQNVTKSKFFKNPMHRSGLALAGAETTIEAWKRNELPPVENDGICKEPGW
jgi:hypothetical protein